MNQKMVESAMRRSNWLQEMEAEGGQLHPSQRLKTLKAKTLIEIDLKTGLVSARSARTEELLSIA